MDNTFVPQWHQIWRRNQGISVGLTALAGTLLVASGAVKQDWKPLPLGAVLLASALAKSSRRVADDARGVLEDAEVLSKVQRQRQMLHHFSGRASTGKDTTGYTPKLFDWRRFHREPDKFPHILVLGATGSGKTTAAEYLGYLIAGATQRLPYALSPHLSPKDFAGFRRRFGSAGYVTKDQPMLTWEDLEHIDPTVSQVLYALFQEMERRYELYHKGLPFGDPIDIMWDEVPACYDRIKGLGAIIQPLMMEARKVGIRLWVLAQGQTVSLLGLEGRSDLKESYTFIRLGEFALIHADWLLSVERISQEDYAWLKAQTNPCMVGDEIALLPDLRLLQETVYAAMSAQPRQKPSTASVTPVVSQQAVSVQGDDHMLLGQYLEGTERGLSKSQIITDIWGYSGDRYQEGLVRWKALNLP